MKAFFESRFGSTILGAALGCCAPVILSGLRTDSRLVAIETEQSSMNKRLERIESQFVLRSASKLDPLAGQALTRNPLPLP